MSLIMQGFTSAAERFRRHGGAIALFALVLLSVQAVIRAVSFAAHGSGVLATIVTSIAAFLVVVYLSYVALRFSVRALQQPVFDFSIRPRGFAALLVGQLFLLGVSLPALASFALLAVPLARRATHDSVGELLDPVAHAIPLPVLGLIALASVYLLVRLSMTSLRIAVRGDGPLEAIRRSWSMTRYVFWPLLGYSLIPLVILTALSTVLLVLWFPMASLGPAGTLAIGLAALLVALVYLLAIDPALAIGKARIFSELEDRAAA